MLNYSQQIKANIRLLKNNLKVELFTIEKQKIRLLMSIFHLFFIQLIYFFVTIFEHAYQCIILTNEISSLF